MLSFPIDFYCEYHKEDPAPEWMTGERMSFCEQPETRENGVLGGIMEFLSRLFGETDRYGM